MNQVNNNTNKRKFQHFSLEERKIIERLLKNNYSISNIAKILGKNKSSVSREIKKGTRIKQVVNKTNNKYEPYFVDVEYYDATFANEKYERNKHASGRISQVFQLEFLCTELDRLIVKEGYAPDAALHIFMKNYPNEKCVCVKTIYNWIDCGFLKTKNIDLPLKVRRRPKKVHNISKKTRGTSIEERPKEVNDKIEFGHFEGDSVIPKGQKGQIITLTERKTKYSFTFRYENKSSKNIVNALGKLNKMIGGNLNKLVKSITFDNGTEFSSWEKIEKKYNIKVYFAHPYSSFERGINEHFNGMLRRKIKKSMSIKQITKHILEKATIWVNNMPRKNLGYQSALECFKRETKQLTKNLA
ncbi:MAG: IS30 family transposase [Christensenellales bacterium]